MGNSQSLGNCNELAGIAKVDRAGEGQNIDSEGVDEKKEREDDS